jgi:hypothetical protein
MELATMTKRCKAVLFFAGALVLLSQSIACGPHAYVTSSAVATTEGTLYAFSTKDAYVCALTSSKRPVCTEASQK